MHCEGEGSGKILITSNSNAISSEIPHADQSLFSGRRSVVLVGFRDEQVSDLAQSHLDYPL